MATRRLVSCLVLVTALAASNAMAGQSAKRMPEPVRRAQPAPAADPFAPVFVVSSQETWRGSMRGLARNAVLQRDPAGRWLVVSELKAHQLPDLGRQVHDNELRCGGYFAFATRAEAMAFIRADQSLMARKRLPTTDYRIDNAATVAPWLPQVQEAAIRATINHLSVAYPSRYYASNNGRNAATWIRDIWLELANNRSDVSAELFTGCGNCSIQPSVILTVQGTEFPNEIVVLGAHLDSISNSGSGDGMFAPGADDDASGIATLTEVIRIALANGWKPKRTVKFMGYAAEEVGLRGSNAIAQSFRAQGRNVVGALQLDMTNYRAAGQPVHMRVVTDYSNAALSQHMAAMFDAYLAPLGYSRGTYACGYGCSDHASWTSAGFPSTMMFEAGTAGGYFPYIHSVNDTLPAMGGTAEPSVAFGQLGLVFLAEMAKTRALGGNVFPVAAFRVGQKGYTAHFGDLSTDADGAIVAWRWDFGDGTSAVEANPVKTYAQRGTYRVTLTVTDDRGGKHTREQRLALPSGLGQGIPDKRQPGR